MSADQGRSARAAEVAAPAGPAGEPSHAGPGRTDSPSAAASGRLGARAPEDPTRRSKRAIAGWRRIGLGRPLPVPAFGVALGGGAVTAPLGGLLQWTPVGGSGLATPLALLLALGMHGAAAGALAGVAVGRVERRGVLLGAGVGAAIGAALALAPRLHESLLLVAFVALASLPAVLFARALRLPAREAVPLWAHSLIAVGAGTMPLGAALFFANRAVFDLPPPLLVQCVLAIVGALAWYRPASYRPGARG
jgi:hypothetical protein